MIKIPAGAALAEPIYLSLNEACPKISVTAGEHARFSLITDYAGFHNEKFLSNAVVEITLGAGSALEFLQFERYGNQTRQFVTNRFFLKKESTLNMRQFTQGGAVTRNETEVRFEGPGAQATLKGLSLLSGESEVYQHAVIRHDFDNCRSRQFYKSVLADNAKSEFDSLVVVGHGTKGSCSEQLNRNLLLSDSAQAFSRPQLQINADDVQCKHGATVGQIEKEELFYLRSRGLSEKEARFMLTYGFAHEFVEEIASPLLRAQMEKLVREELKRVIDGTSSH